MIEITHSSHSLTKRYIIHSLGRDCVSCPKIIVNQEMLLDSGWDEPEIRCASFEESAQMTGHIIAGLQCAQAIAGALKLGQVPEKINQRKEYKFI